MSISYAVFCLKKKKKNKNPRTVTNTIHHTIGVQTSLTRSLTRTLCPTSHLFLLHSLISPPVLFLLFFFNDTATTEIYTLSLHDALPISTTASCTRSASSSPGWWRCCWWPS